MKESNGNWVKRCCRLNTQHSFFPIHRRRLRRRKSLSISRWLAQDGALVATFLTGEEDSAQTGWIYPDCVNYRPATLERAAKDLNLRFEILDWKHPRQTWALFAAPKFDSSWFKNTPLTWNTALERALS